MKPVINPEDVNYGSFAWRQIETKLLERLRYAQTKLETCSADDLCKYQTEIRLLRELIQLPEKEES